MQRTVLALLVIVVLVGLSGGAWWLSRRSVQPADPLPRSPVVVEPANDVTPTPLEAPRTTASDGAVDYGSLETTVVYPLEVELELVEARYKPVAPGVPPLGTGSNAVLKGRIVGADTRGVRAEVTFVGGTNVGRVLHCDGNGEFGANDLQPGLGIVTVTGPGIQGSQREVRLRQQRETQLNVSYARPGRVAGTVYDHEAKPLADALVTFDGQETRTSETGAFEFPSVAPGEVLVLVEKPGFALYRELFTVMFAGKQEDLKFRLQRGARLQVNVPDRLNATEQAWFFLLPEADGGERRFPWHLVNPQRVWSGGTITIDNLPTGTYSARLFQSGAETKPKVASVTLGPADTTVVEFHLEPGPVIQGVVKDAGRPAIGVTVRLEAPDRTAANLSVFQRENYLFLENDVFPNLPSAVQEVVSNGQGEFTLSANDSISPVRYVTATSKDQKRGAFVVLKPGDTSVELVLQPIEDGRSTLRLVTNPRHQALPLAVTVNGAPREKTKAPPGRDIVIGELSSGAWVVSARWRGEPILRAVPVDIDGEVSREIVLPEGAIVGQDADTVLRSGQR